ncbi:MAG: hypothetical protein ALAOOOJD_03657 [bacterium]|nr:hypothetical protein [bacterium]
MADFSRARPNAGRIARRWLRRKCRGQIFIGIHGNRFDVHPTFKIAGIAAKHEAGGGCRCECDHRAHVINAARRIERNTARPNDVNRHGVLRNGAKLRRDLFVGIHREIHRRAGSVQITAPIIKLPTGVRNCGHRHHGILIIHAAGRIHRHPAGTGIRHRQRALHDKARVARSGSSGIGDTELAGRCARRHGRLNERVSHKSKCRRFVVETHGSRAAKTAAFDRDLCTHQRTNWRERRNARRCRDHKNVRTRGAAVAVGHTNLARRCADRHIGANLCIRIDDKIRRIYAVKSDAGRAQKIIAGDGDRCSHRPIARRKRRNDGRRGHQIIGCARTYTKSIGNGDFSIRRTCRNGGADECVRINRKTGNRYAVKFHAG